MLLDVQLTLLDAQLSENYHHHRPPHVPQLYITIPYILISILFLQVDGCAAYAVGSAAYVRSVRIRLTKSSLAEDWTELGNIIVSPK